MKKRDTLLKDKQMQRIIQEDSCVIDQLYQQAIGQQRDATYELKIWDLLIAKSLSSRDTGYFCRISGSVAKTEVAVYLKDRA